MPSVYYSFSSDSISDSKLDIFKIEPCGDLIQISIVLLYKYADERLVLPRVCVISLCVAAEV